MPQEYTQYGNPLSSAESARALWLPLCIWRHCGLRCRLACRLRGSNGGVFVVNRKAQQAGAKPCDVCFFLLVSTNSHTITSINTSSKFTERLCNINCVRIVDVPTDWLCWCNLFSACALARSKYRNRWWLILNRNSRIDLDVYTQSSNRAVVNLSASVGFVRTCSQWLTTTRETFMSEESALSRMSSSNRPLTQVQPYWNNSLAIRQEIQRFESVHPSIYAIYDLIESIPDPVLGQQIRDHVVCIEGRINFHLPITHYT